jgi:4-aminobutyrate aminotransferase
METPDLRVPHPGPRTRALAQRLRRIEPAAGLSLGLTPDGLFVESAAGAVITDVDGNRFLDFVAGFGSLNAGHSHPRIAEAIAAQAATAQQAMSFSAAVRVELAERLLAPLPDPDDYCVLFAASGGEAVEVALKLARRATQRDQVVAFAGAFHGRTQGALALMGRSSQRQGLPQTTPGAYHVPYPYPLRSPWGPDPQETCHQTLQFLQACLTDPASGWRPPAAVFVEPVQGNGGMIPAPPGFLRGLRSLCDEHGMALVADEVMSGFYRTGPRFAFEAEPDVRPDIIVLGKSLSSGLPLAACIVRRAIADASPPITETSTYAGNLVACAAALAAQDVYESGGFGDRAVRLGTYFVEQLRTVAGHHAIVGEVRGRGLMVGVELVAPDGSGAPLSLAADASQRAIRHGLLVYPGGHWPNVIAYLPPLVIDERDIDTAVGITDTVLGELAAAIEPG